MEIRVESAEAVPPRAPSLSSRMIRFFVAMHEINERRAGWQVRRGQPRADNHRHGGRGPLPSVGALLRPTSDGPSLADEAPRVVLEAPASPVLFRLPRLVVHRVRVGEVSQPVSSFHVFALGHIIMFGKGPLLSLSFTPREGGFFEGEGKGPSSMGLV
ncbi:hypothetical protein B296_00050504 [Ensete ventricosum]|uniref:Uncharacterized protein n=1 Tax=Ensete ventricosum TaxID=4639 RepID=A0A426YEI9_ENSVE|nr:hypothetical protein B296_00050504 [Ensete ventricosum]